MSVMVKKQNQFAVAVAKLILFADDNGMTITLGDAYRDPRVHGAIGIKKGYGKANSCHKLRLAIDLNLIVDGKLAQPDRYASLHDFWESIGGSQRIANDMNHFSFAHGIYR